MQSTHGEYADEQLATPQKRICLIEFLHLGLVIVCQGQEFVSAINLPAFWRVIFIMNMFLLRFPNFFVIVMRMKEKINPLNKSLIVSALSPDRIDIVVTKLDYFGNGQDVFEIRHWVVKNKHNQTVFLFKRETLKDTYKFTIKINGLEISAEQGKSVTDSFWAKLDKMLHDKEKRQRLLNVTAIARKVMSVPNGVIYDHLVSTLQR